MSSEVRYWAKFNYEITSQVQDIVAREEKLRISREMVNTLVRDYNDIIRSLSPNEFRLFRERIAILDKKVHPGLTSLHWSSKGLIDYFVIECRKFCKEVQSVIEDFKRNVAKINEICATIGNTELAKIETKKIYSDGQFEKSQSKHRTTVRQKLQTYNDDLVRMMQHIHQYFATDSEDIQKEWRAFVGKVQGKIESSLHTTVKRSLYRISTAINGDKRNQDTSINPIFSVNLVLESVEDYEHTQPSLKPSVKELSDVIEKVVSQLLRIISIVPMLEIQLADGNTLTEEVQDSLKKNEKRNEKANNYYESVKDDSEIISLRETIMNGITKINSEVISYISKWDEDFKSIWTVDKDKAIKRFHQPVDRPVISFKKEIEKYKDHQIEIQRRESSRIIGYLQLDCQPLKQTLVGECNTWQNKLLELLHSIAWKELQKIYAIFDSTYKQLNEDPVSLDMLSKKLDVLKKIQIDYPKAQQRFATIGEQYKLLDEYEYTVKDDESDKLAKLIEKGDEFSKFLLRAKKALDITRNSLVPLTTRSAHKNEKIFEKTTIGLFVQQNWRQSNSCSVNKMIANFPV